MGLSHDIRSAINPILPYLPHILASLLLLSYVKAWYGLRQFRGPWPAGFSYLWMATVVGGGRMNIKFNEVSKQYGSRLARIGPEDLITDDPDIIRHMSSARSTYYRSEWYAAARLDPYVDNVISEMDNASHDKIRSQIAGAYAGKENHHLEEDIDEQISSFISLIRRKYLSSGANLRPMDFGRKAQYFTLDVLTKIAYGDAFGYLKRDEDVHEYIETIESMMPSITFFSCVPLANNFLNRSWVRKAFGPSPMDKKGVGKLMGVAQRVVSDRYGANRKEKMDMLGAFVRHGLPQRRVEAEVLLQIIAGSDTTATGVRATMLYLITAPRVLQKLRAEMDDAEATGAISSPITNAEAKELPYLQACIKEGLRMHPPFTGLILKRVPAGGDVIGGQFVPGHTRIAHNTWAVQRSTIYGDDPDMFRPERWVEADADMKVKMERNLELIFGYGRFGCLGKSIAYIELNKIFVELLRRFDIEVVDPTKPLWNSVNFNMHLQHHQWVRISEREARQSQL
ncbi:cytochrome P450 [Lepidopterella palustris CBS 459.81]|uniref:Cytochrome P450 monooxygenase ABA1 n=1 Tax=Lepidopterella palustris CBS 459.81 TaxID=1314670 RepID=A0A8E2E3T5_9PEZI|nr:cytochrome P450 [Lepidopterella palustris CBS 459.81]